MQIEYAHLAELGIADADLERVRAAFAPRSADGERLEFLGDSVVGLVITRYVHARFDDRREGTLTKRRSRLVCGQTMAQLALKLGLDRFVQLGAGAGTGADAGAGANEARRRDPDVLEDTFEALAGALFLDLGYDRVERWVVDAYEKHLSVAELIADDLEHKDRLLKHFAAAGRDAPEFVLVARDRGEYRVAARTGRDNVLGVGRGRTRRAAENAAADNALRYIG